MGEIMSRNPKTWFIVKCFIASELLMFGSMASRELFFDPNLFSGFLSKPEIWYGIFLETALATLLVCLIGVWILSWIKFKDRRNFLIASIGTWVLLCSFVVAVYKIFYFPREWKLTSIEPGLIFGWIIPGVLTLACFAWFSEKLHHTQLRN